jgi:hypothetical protein
MSTLTIHLISRFNYGAENIGEGGLYALGQYIVDFFREAIKGSKVFTGAQFRYNADPGQVGSRDLVCYMLSHSGRSIAARHNNGQLGQGGSTVWSLRSQAMISEIYMDATTGDPSRSRLLANLIIHELMHNKLDAHPASTGDVHNIKNGRVSTAGAITSASTPSLADIAAMRRGIDVEMPQHTGDFQEFSF